MSYRAPEFHLESLQHEVEKLSRIAADFIDVSSVRVLPQAAGDLKTFGNSRKIQESCWQIRDQEGLRLRTKPTREFEPGGGGGYDVFGELAFTWGIKLTDATRNESRFNRKFFQVTGNASTQIRIKRCEGNATIAQWQFEIGADGSPGCFFHVGIGKTGDELFPASLPVPRIPALLVTPTDALDFLLGELFQLEWPRVNSVQGEHTLIFGRLQRARIKHMLDWYLKALPAPGKSGSAWLGLKRAKSTTEIPFTTPSAS